MMVTVLLKGVNTFCPSVMTPEYEIVELFFDIVNGVLTVYPSELYRSLMALAKLSAASAFPAKLGVGEFDDEVVFDDDVHPTTNKEATTSKRTIIAVIGLNCIRVCKW